VPHNLNKILYSEEINVSANQISIARTKLLENINLKEERFILTHAFKGFSPRSLGSIGSGVW
jgi:hypothetical protein